jgi:hypothetical protein
MTPTLAQFTSLTIQIEGILNSRPLTPMSSDPQDLLVLTPAHFLIGRPITAPPSSDVSSVQLHLVKHHQQVQAWFQRFWIRWYRIPSLQTRNKWVKPTRNLAPGDLVFIQEPKARYRPGAPRSRWHGQTSYCQDSHGSLISTSGEGVVITNSLNFIITTYDQVLNPHPSCLVFFFQVLLLSAISIFQPLSILI